MKYPNRLRELREQAGLSQAALADRANTTQPQIDRLEKGERRLTLDWLKRLAVALGVPQASILIDAGASIPPHQPWGSNIDLRTPTDLAEVIRKTLERGQVDEALALTDLLLARLKLIRSLHPDPPNGGAPADQPASQAAPSPSPAKAAKAA